jgi:WD40 repeat protein/serine/threonine protein kinase
MTPDETSPTRVSERLLEQVMACDAMLHASAGPPGGKSLGRGPATEADDRARSRLLLLLTMLEAMGPATDQPADSNKVAVGKGRVDAREVLGRFEISEDLGSGGFGFVVRARDRLLGREVALKMPLPGTVLSHGDVRAFLREARAAARLDHPNIVRVHDAGELGPLGYFIASELCVGPTLRRWVKAQNEPVPTRLAARWVAALADAVQHAHDRGILHRDIKPDNVILTGAPVPDDFIPRLTDFGLAKVIEEPGDESRSGALVGTPHYMAPEQASGRRREVGPATDVYALGATLYEVLTNRPPFRGETNAETIRLVLESEPVPPRSLRPGLPRDLETICLKCLRKEPARRYATASALRDDLQRFLGGQPILGRPVSTWERMRIWTRRRPAVAALSGLVFLLVGGLLGGVVSWASWLRWHNRQLEIQVARADREARDAENQRGLARERGRLSDRHHYAEGLRRARQALDAHQIELAQEILHDDQPELDEADRRGFAWRYLWRQANRDFSQLWGHHGRLLDGATAPDGRSVATVDLAGNALVWNLADRAGLDRPTARASTPFPEHSVFQFSRDGRFLAFGTVNSPGTPQGFDVFDCVAARSLVDVELHASDSVLSMAFDDRLKLFVSVVRGRGGFRIEFHDLVNPTAKPRARSLDPTTNRAFLAPDGRAMVVQNRAGVELTEPKTGRVLACLADAPAELVGAARFSLDGRYVAGIWANQILAWETRRGQKVARSAIQSGLAAFEWSPRGRFLVWGESHGRLAILEPSSGQVRERRADKAKRTLRGLGLSFSQDERLLVTTAGWIPGGPTPTQVWDLDSGRKIGAFPGRSEGGSAHFISGAHEVLVTPPSGPRIWRLEPSAEPDALGGHSAEAWAVAFAPGGQVLATGSDDTCEKQTIKLWDRSSGKLLGGWKAHTATVASLSFSPDGNVLASGSLDSGKPGNPNLILWQVASRRPVAHLEGHTGRVRSVAFSPDGRLLASASDDQTVRLWDVAGQTTRAVLTGHTKNLTSIAFSPDGQTLASASNDSTVRLWDVATGQARDTLQDVGNVLSVVFAPDGSLLASGNENGEIRLWNALTGSLLFTIRGEADQIRCLAFTPDSQEILAAGKAKVIRTWDVVTGQELLSLDGHKAQINALAFSPDGSILASCSHDGAVRLWRGSEPELPTIR